MTNNTQPPLAEVMVAVEREDLTAAEVAELEHALESEGWA